MSVRTPTNLDRQMARRAKRITSHIVPSSSPSPSNSLLVSLTSGLVASPTTLPSDIKTEKVDLSTLQEDFSFRHYISSTDDNAFRALDYLCYQGTKTKLVSEFSLKHKWEDIQPRGSCLVAEDHKGDMAGLARSYIYDCVVNGKPSSTSYVFLIRIHPDYRRQNLALYLSAKLFYRDVTEDEVQYMTSWVLVDNTASLGLQDRIAQTGSAVYGMPDCEVLAACRSIGVSFSDLVTTDKNGQRHFRELLTSSLSAPRTQTYQFRMMGKKEDVAMVASHYGDSQFFPADLPTLLEAQLSLGVYSLSDYKVNPETGLKEMTTMASLSVWNSGEIRVSSFRDSDFRSDRAVLLYNPWMHPSKEGQRAFATLVEEVCLDLHSKGFKFLHVFFPETSPQGCPRPVHTNFLWYDELHNNLSVDAKMNVAWRARVWYVRNKTRLDMDAFPNVFYDPRQSLI